MKKWYLFLVFCYSGLLIAQEDAWVYFKDKSSVQSYIDNPLLMLSQRSLDRRKAQNIVLDSKDYPIANSYKKMVRETSGITVMGQSKWMNTLHVRGSITAIKSLLNLTFVDKIAFADRSLNTSKKVTVNAKPQKINKLKKTAIAYNYGNAANQIQMLNGQILHQKDFTGKGKIIAVMDSGFPGVNTAQAFKKMRDNQQILGGYDYVNRKADFYSGDNHGTLVLSTIGGYQDNEIVGTAPDANFYLFVTENDASENPIEETLWVEAAEKADSLGVDIINSSLGYLDFDNPKYNYSYSDMNGNTAFISRGAEIASSRGMIVVASAGNAGNSATPTIAAPADATSVLTVGAVTASGVKASFSSIGPSADGRIKPDVMAQGQATVVVNEFGNLATANGTSFSSPVMAGMVACLWQAFPEKTAQQIRDIILKSSSLYANPTNQMGYGIPNFNTALNEGLLSAFSTVDLLFVVYPNPSQDRVEVQLPSFLSQATIEIINLLGQKITEHKVTTLENSFSVSQLPRGEYLYILRSDQYNTSGKIIKK